VIPIGLGMAGLVLSKAHRYCTVRYLTPDVTSSGMPTWDEVGALLHALEAVVPTGADVSSITFSSDARLVTISTKTPGLILGRRGSTAALIREALSEASGAEIGLHIQEVDEPPPDDPLGGVREPGDPLPLEPEPGVQISEPGQDPMDR
jgi:hypothetical protein